MMEQNGGITIPVQKGYNMSGLMNKYDIGQDVWTMLNNKVQRVTIAAVDIHIRCEYITVTYNIIKCYGRTGSIAQCDLHATKYDLLETL